MFRPEGADILKAECVSTKDNSIILREYINNPNLYKQLPFQRNTHHESNTGH